MLVFFVFSVAVYLLLSCLQAYFQPDVERSWFTKFDDATTRQGAYIALGSMKQIACNVIKGGAMRLSHFAIEAGSSQLARREMFEPLGGDPQWDPAYVWGHVMDSLLRFIRTDGSPFPRHAPTVFARIDAVESKQSRFQDAWYKDAHRVTGLPVVLDFNTIDGSLQSIGGEPSNIQPNATDAQQAIRSTTENEYLLPEIAINNSIVLVRDCRVTRVLFARARDGARPRAIGVAGTFHNRPFTVRLRRARPITQPGNLAQIRCGLREVHLTAGTIYNPHLLLYSGVGDRATLARFGIPLVHHNANVGAHLKECSSSHLLFTIAATRRDIGYYPAFPSPIVQSRPGMFENMAELGGKQMFFLATPLDFNFSRVIFAISFEADQDREGYVTLTEANFGEDPLVYYNWNVQTLDNHVAVFREYRRIVNSGGVLQRPAVETPLPAGQALAADTVVEGPNEIPAGTQFPAQTTFNADLQAPAGTPVPGAPGFTFPLAQAVVSTEAGTSTAAITVPFAPYLIQPAWITLRAGTVPGATIVLPPGFQAIETDPGPTCISQKCLRDAVRRYNQPVNHLSCTTRMALSDSDGVVDTSFRVFGVDGLRLGSQSVMRWSPGAGGQFWSLAAAFNRNNAVRRELGLPVL